MHLPQAKYGRPSLPLPPLFPASHARLLLGAGQILQVLPSKQRQSQVQGQEQLERKVQASLAFCPSLPTFPCLLLSPLWTLRQLAGETAGWKTRAGRGTGWRDVLEGELARDVLENTENRLGK